MEAFESLEKYLEYLSEGLGHKDRRQGLREYCQGLMLPIERKSVEPMAAHTDPERVGAKHQSLHHFVAKSEWSDEVILERVRNFVLPKMHLDKGCYWIIDDTSFPKQGKHSAGVARQYCGALGKLGNCQVAVSLSVATESASLPVAYRLYLPRDWVDDKPRLNKVEVPADVAFMTKQEIALSQVRKMKEAGVLVGVVLADAGYGQITSFRQTLTELEIPYAVGVTTQTVVWLPGTAPLPPNPRKYRGRPAKNFLSLFDGYATLSQALSASLGDR